MNDRSADESRDRKLEAAMEDFEAMFDAGEIDFEEIRQRLDEIVVASDDTWLIHFVELPFTLDLPEIGEFTPWMGVILDRETDDMIFADMAEAEPDAEDIGLFLVTGMTMLATAPASIEVIDDAVGEALAPPADALGMTLSRPEEDLPMLREAMEEFANGLSRDEIMRALEGDE